MEQAYPLQWPAGVQRTPPIHQLRSPFRVSDGQCVASLHDAIRLLRGTMAVVSSNIAIRRDGKPYANQRRVDDPGVAVYFSRKDQRLCLACDRYRGAYANMRAIALTLKDMRGLEIRGVNNVLDRVFTGFTALPPPRGSSPWHEELGLDADHRTEEHIRAAWKKRVVKARQNGDEDLVMRLNTARDAALRQIGPASK